MEVKCLDDRKAVVLCSAEQTAAEIHGSTWENIIQEECGGGPQGTGSGDGRGRKHGGRVASWPGEEGKGGRGTKDNWPPSGKRCECALHLFKIGFLCRGYREVLHQLNYLKSCSSK